MNRYTACLIILLGFTPVMGHPSSNISIYPLVRTKIIVVDPMGARVSNAQIHLACKKTNKKLLANEFGVVLVRLPKGKCVIEVNKIGFTTLKNQFFIHKKSSDPIFEFVLKPVSWDHPEGLTPLRSLR